MTAKLHYNLLGASSFTESSATSGYPVANTAFTAVRRPWVGTAAANGSNDEWVQHDYGSTQTIAAIAVQSCLQSGSVLVGTGTPPATTYGTIDTTTVVTDHHGIRKGSWSGAASARYVRADFTNAANARGTGVFATYGSSLMELGCLYVFGSSMDLPVDPLIDSEVEYHYPQSLEKLPNGTEVPIDRGAPLARIRLRFNARTTDIELIARIARAGLCWLDLGIASDRRLQWPVRMVDDKHTRPLARPRAERVSLGFREIT